MKQKQQSIKLREKHRRITELLAQDDRKAQRAEKRHIQWSDETGLKQQIQE